MSSFSENSGTFLVLLSVARLQKGAYMVRVQLIILYLPVTVRKGTGNRHAESAKLRHAILPLRANAATSWARAAISGVGYVPSQIRDLLFGVRTSHTQRFPFLCLTPLYTGCLVSLNFFLPARFLGQLDASMTSSSEDALGADENGSEASQTSPWLGTVAPGWE